jgi:predicted transcriptional regulator
MLALLDERRGLLLFAERGMTRPERPGPTDAELMILNVLWDQGPCTVRQVHTALSGQHEVVYTTVLKLLQIMTEKGLVARDESQRSHVYRARRKKDETQRQLLRRLVDRAFGGSTEKLVLQALSTKRASKEELSEIRRMLDGLERGAS